MSGYELVAIAAFLAVLFSLAWSSWRRSSFDTGVLSFEMSGGGFEYTADRVRGLIAITSRRTFVKFYNDLGCVRQERGGTFYDVPHKQIFFWAQKDVVFDLLLQEITGIHPSRVNAKRRDEAIGRLFNESRAKDIYMPPGPYYRQPFSREMIKAFFGWMVRDTHEWSEEKQIAM